MGSCCWPGGWEWEDNLWLVLQCSIHLQTTELLRPCGDFTQLAFTDMWRGPMTTEVRLIRSRFYSASLA